MKDKESGKKMDSTLNSTLIHVVMWGLFITPFVYHHCSQYGTHVDLMQLLSIL